MTAKTKIFKHTQADGLSRLIDKWLLEDKPKIVAMSQSTRELSIGAEIIVVIVYVSNRKRSKKRVAGSSRSKSDKIRPQRKK
ncbi:MAG TPA: hypothetical protein VI432_00005 [Candidatus Paceibacterota bacterium]